MISTPLDGRGPGALPANRQRREQGDRPKQPAFWAVSEALDLQPTVDVYGQYPKGFVAWALRALGVQGSEVLHVCSGALTAAEVQGGVRVDLRPEVRPDVIADGRALPFADGSFGAVMLDPPYSVEYAASLYGIEYPRPTHLLREAARVVRPGGSVALLHFLTAPPMQGLEWERCYGVTTGPGYRIRAWTLMRRPAASLLDE